MSEDKVSGKIGNAEISIEFGDMTAKKAGAYIVPEFTSEWSPRGVGGAVIQGGGFDGMQAYQKNIIANGPLEFGDVLVTKSGGGNAEILLHMASVDSGADKEMSVVQQSFYNALKAAEENGISTIVSPAPGTGIIGDLTGEQSAKAVMSAIQQHEEEGGATINVSFVIFRNPYSPEDAERDYEGYVNVLQSGSYENAVMEKGMREFDNAKWLLTIERDAQNVKDYLDGPHKQQKTLNKVKGRDVPKLKKDPSRIKKFGI